MAVEFSITSLRIARIASESPGSASLSLYIGFMSNIVDIMAAFGERLRAERQAPGWANCTAPGAGGGRARGWTIERLAAASGVSRAMISKIERGESSPTAVVLGKLSAALELSISQLLAPGRPGASSDVPAGHRGTAGDADIPGGLAPAPGGGTVRRAAGMPEWRDPDTG